MVLRKAVILQGILIVLVFIGLSGCNDILAPSDSEADKFVGAWRSTIPEYSTWLTVFYSNGTVLSTEGDVSLNGTWNVKDGRITIKMIDDEAPITYTFSFSEANTMLTLTSVSSGEVSVFTKQ